jgi:hypothetical protein
VNGEPIHELLSRAGLPRSEVDCIGRCFAFTYVVDCESIRLVGRIDGLQIQVGDTPVQLTIISTGLGLRNPPELGFWREIECLDKTRIPAHWKLAFYNTNPNNVFRKADYFEGEMELLS